MNVSTTLQRELMWIEKRKWSQRWPKCTKITGNLWKSEENQNGTFQEPSYLPNHKFEVIPDAATVGQFSSELTQKQSHTLHFNSLQLIWMSLVPSHLHACPACGGIGKSPWHLRAIRVACVACHLRAFACAESCYKSVIKIIRNITTSFCVDIRVWNVRINSFVQLFW
jgi:hypothetical protein